jgi:hypothetical protein
MKMSVLWVVALRGLVIIALMEAAGTSETSVNICKSRDTKKKTAIFTRVMPPAHSQQASRLKRINL